MLRSTFLLLAVDSGRRLALEVQLKPLVEYCRANRLASEHYGPDNIRIKFMNSTVREQDDSFARAGMGRPAFV
jgi:hypothetical protein